MKRANEAWIPWEGQRYERGKGLLILSESAYCWEQNGETECPDIDHPEEHTVKLWALSEKFDQRKSTEARYIVWLTRALCRKYDPSPEERAVAWNKVAYSIYIQNPMQNRSVRPTSDQFKSSGAPFLDLTGVLRPAKVIVTSLTAWKNMPPTQATHPYGEEHKEAFRLSDDSLVWCLAVPHPRARKMGWEFFSQVVDDFVGEQLPRC